MSSESDLYAWIDEEEDNVSASTRTTKAPGGPGDLIRSQPLQGEVLREIDLDGIRCRDLLYPPDLVLEAHTHPEVSLSVCLSGSVMEILPHRTYEIGISSVLVRPSGVTHANRVGPSHLRAMVIEIDSVESFATPPLLETLASPSHFRNAKVTVLARAIASEMRVASAGRDLSARGLVLEILAEVSREKYRRTGDFPDWLRKTTEYMREHPVDRHTSRSLARRYGLHPAYFARVLGNTLHCTVATYSLNLRIEEAARQLVETDKPVANIAKDCRFSSQSQFTRSFTNMVGLSPIRYRRLLAREASDARMRDRKRGASSFEPI